MITPETYNRKTFEIEAVQVTAENMAEVADWCGGDIQTQTRNGETNEYIHVDVSRPLNERQGMAFPTDWVLKAGTGFKVYTDPAFHKCFEKHEEAPFKIWNGQEWLPMDETMAKRFLGPLVVETMREELFTSNMLQQAREMERIKESVATDHSSKEPEEEVLYEKTVKPGEVPADDKLDIPETPNVKLVKDPYLQAGFPKRD